MDGVKAFARIVSESGMSKRLFSRAMGRSDNYVSSYIARGITPQVDTMALAADVAGYDLLLRNRETHRVIYIDPPRE